MPDPGNLRGRRPPAAALIAVCGVGAIVAVTGLLVGVVVMQAAGAAIVMSMLPPALMQLTGGPDDADDDEGEGPGGGGSRGPDDPDDLPPVPGLDWDGFDAARRAWERTPVGRA